MAGVKELTPVSVWAEYELGKRFNNQINLEDTVENNENFFIGKQWEGVASNGLPTPVFNFLKRATLFQVAVSYTHLDTDEYLSDAAHMSVCDWGTVIEIEPAVIPIFDMPVGTDLTLIYDNGQKYFVDTRTGERVEPEWPW